MQRVPGVSPTDVQGNGFFQDLRYRGFAASPLQGTPQGIAVYVNGMRINEAFGDTVNWDLIPASAIDRADVWTSNPVFGLNALGGAVSIQMKNGFTYQGTSAEVSGRLLRPRQRLGAVRRAQGQLSRSMPRPKASPISGWRYQSPVAAQALLWRPGLAGRRRTRSTSAPAPLRTSSVSSARRRSRCSPRTRSRSTLGHRPRRTRWRSSPLNGKFDLSDPWSMQTGLYCGIFARSTSTATTPTSSAAAATRRNPLFNTLCLDDDGFPAPCRRGNFQILDPQQPADPVPAGPRHPVRVVPYGTVDRTSTDARRPAARCSSPTTPSCSDTATRSRPAASIDHGRISFDANSELGYIYPDLFVGPNAAVPGTGSYPHRRQHRLRPGHAERAQHLLRALCARHLRHHQAAFGHGRRAAQRRADQDGRSARHQPGPERHRTPSAGSTR